MNSDRSRLFASLVLGAAVLGTAGGLVLTPGPKAPTVPTRPLIRPNVTPPCPNCPKPPDRPKRPRRPWREQSACRSAGKCCDAAGCKCGSYCSCGPLGKRCAKGCDCENLRSRDAVGDPEPAVDLLAAPGRKRNIASKGLGCCVFRSIEYASIWQSVPAFAGFPEWMVQTGVPGGGYPTKVDQLIPRIAKDRGVPTPAYVQYQGNDPAIIELALKTGRLPCVTWQGNHMLNCVHLDASSAAIVDNNAPEKVQWFSRAEFLRKWKQGGGAWVVVLLAAPPPPPPAGDRRTAPSLTPELFGDVASRVLGHIYGVERSLLREFGTSLWDERGWIRSGHECYAINGRPATAHAVAAALTDDSALPHLTVIGPEAERKGLLADLDASAVLAPWKGKLLVQGYAPSDWQVSCGFVSAGLQVYLQDRTGRVLLRSAGPVTAEQLAGKLRRADPSYDPAKDPSGEPGTPATGASWRATALQYGPGLVALVAMLGMVLLLRSGKSAAAPPGQPATPAPTVAADPLAGIKQMLALKQQLDELFPRK